MALSIIGCITDTQKCSSVCKTDQGFQYLSEMCGQIATNPSSVFARSDTYFPKDIKQCVILMSQCLQHIRNLQQRRGELSIKKILKTAPDAERGFSSPKQNLDSEGNGTSCATNVVGRKDVEIFMILV